MQVRAKFRVTNINKDYDTQRTVYLSAVKEHEDDNNQWSKYTPAGQIILTITNPTAYDQFEVGKFYYVDFTLSDG